MPSRTLARKTWLTTQSAAYRRRASTDLLGGVNEIGQAGIWPLADGLTTRCGC